MVVISAVVLLFVLMFLNVPVYHVFDCFGAGLLHGFGIKYDHLVQKMARGLSSTTLLAVDFHLRRYPDEQQRHPRSAV